MIKRLDVGLGGRTLSTVLKYRRTLGCVEVHAASISADGVSDSFKRSILKSISADAENFVFCNVPTTS